MNSRRTARFRELFDRLPKSAQRQAEAAYELFAQDPFHPGLHFKRVSERQPVYSARVGNHYRALALRDGNTLFWFWIGTHAQYDELLKRG